MVRDVLSVIEGRRSFEIVPVLSGEGILGSLLETLLALGQTLIPGNNVSQCYFEILLVCLRNCGGGFLAA